MASSIAIQEVAAITPQPAASASVPYPQILDGGVAFLTGAAGGIGAATALAYAHSGAAAVYLTDLASTLTELKALAAKCVAEASRPGFEVEIEAMDVTKEEEIDSVVANAAKRFGRIDYAVNVAGVSEFVPCGIADITTAAFDTVFATNVRGLAFCMRAQTRQMRTQPPTPERGSIINMSSIAGHTVIGPLPAYGASKHAVIGLTRYAAAAHADDLIRVNSVSPGFVDTPLVQRLPPPFLEAVTNAPVLKRLARPEEVAATVVWLSSARFAGFVTGKDWLLDGGLVNNKI
ncbi:NAD(P)-binding protein [Peziza echinospora]|nr:NAD(P)-binding protein [Peziza echinospora]